MIREIVKIDETKCTGCGLCVPGCHEGALQIIDGKARLVSELMCDGLGACIGHCPEGAISIEKREADAYNETEVIKEMVTKGKNTIIAHLKHLCEHNQNDYFIEAIKYLESIKDSLTFSLEEVKTEVHNYFNRNDKINSSCGCPGSVSRTFNSTENSNNSAEISSALTNWPIQMHLINPRSTYYKGSDLVIAADCSAFSMGNFHSNIRKGKTLAIMCPKLDGNQQIYLEKLISLVLDARINTITAVIMEVPCCGGIIGIVKKAVELSGRKVPVKFIMISVKGDIVNEEWI